MIKNDPFYQKYVVAYKYFRMNNSTIKLKIDEDIATSTVLTYSYNRRQKILTELASPTCESPTSMITDYTTDHNLQIQSVAKN